MKISDVIKLIEDRDVDEAFKKIDEIDEDNQLEIISLTLMENRYYDEAIRVIDKISNYDLKEELLKKVAIKYIENEGLDSADEFIEKIKSLEKEEKKIKRSEDKIILPVFITTREIIKERTVEKPKKPKYKKVKVGGAVLNIPEEGIKTPYYSIPSKKLEDEVKQLLKKYPEEDVELAIKCVKHMGYNEGSKEFYETLKLSLQNQFYKIYAYQHHIK